MIFTGAGLGCARIPISNLGCVKETMEGEDPETVRLPKVNAIRIISFRDKSPSGQYSKT